MVESQRRLAHPSSLACTPHPLIHPPSLPPTPNPPPPPPPQIPGGWAAQRFGGERMLGVSFALWSAASLLTPGSAANTRTMAAARVFVGLAQVGRRGGG